MVVRRRIYQRLRGLLPRCQDPVRGRRDGPERETYPDPVEHCRIWRDVCVARRRADDHLSLVAGMRREVTRRLVETGVSTVVALAETLPHIEVDRVGRAVLERLRHQAQLQLRQRESGRVAYELLPLEPGLGLGLLPPVGGQYPVQLARAGDRGGGCYAAGCFS
jgi:predicted RecB family nuclease